MASEAEKKCEYSTEYPADCAALASYACEADDRIGKQVIKEYTSKKHTDRESPAEETVSDTLNELEESEYKACTKSLAYAVLYTVETYGEHGKESYRTSPGQLVHSDEAEYDRESYHNSALNEHFDVSLFHKNLLINYKRVSVRYALNYIQASYRF